MSAHSTPMIYSVELVGAVSLFVASHPEIHVIKSTDSSPVASVGPPPRQLRTEDGAPGLDEAWVL